MMASSKGEGEKSKADGVVSGHAYSLIGVHEFEHLGTCVRLVKLRNPWGKGEWNGDWSDKSHLWTPELREKLGCQIEEDGDFFIPYEKYMQEYEWTSVAIDFDR